MHGFVLRYFLIIFIRVFDRTVLYTGGTTRAFVLDDVSWLFIQGDLEVSGFPFDTVDFSKGQDLYIRMPADLDQFGREYSHGAVIGGIGLVELGHVTANGRFLLHQIDLITRIGKIERGLNPADSSTDNHNISEIAVCETFAELFNLFFFHFYPPLSDLVVL